MIGLITVLENLDLDLKNLKCVSHAIKVQEEFQAAIVYTFQIVNALLLRIGTVMGPDFV